jgi:transcriptional regulator with XRE-family HTH domain
MGYSLRTMKKQPSTGFAGRLKQLREAAKLTQEQLAHLAGMHKFGVAKLEQGLREPAWPTVLALAKALSVSCEAFVDETGSKQPAMKRARGRPSKAKSKRG